MLPTPPRLALLLASGVLLVSGGTAARSGFSPNRFGVQTEPECCACGPPASPAPPAPPQKCAASFGSKVGDKPCCGQSGRISDDIHICTSRTPVCRGYSRGAVFGECLTKGEDASRGREEDGEEDSPYDNSTFTDDRDGDSGQDADYGDSNSGLSGAEKNWTSSKFNMAVTVDFDHEVREIKALLGLRPGMTYCEMGGGSGAWLAAVGKAVMPGGRVYVTAPQSFELEDCTRSAKEAGFEAQGEIATRYKSGLPADRCDAVMARMVYHMIDEEVARDVYLPQLGRALRRNGRILFMDHDPDRLINSRRGPNGSYASLHGMRVVPRLQEIVEFTAAGFALLRVMEWPYFGEGQNGFALLWVDAPRAATEPLEPNGTAALHHGQHARGETLTLLSPGSLTALIVIGVFCVVVTALVSCAVLHLVLARERERRGVDERPLRAARDGEDWHL